MERRGVIHIHIYMVTDEPLEKSWGAWVGGRGEVPRKYSYKGKLIKELRKTLTKKVLD